MVLALVNDKEYQQTMIYRTYVKEYSLFINRNAELVTNIQYQKLLNDILEYVRNIKIPQGEGVKRARLALYSQFNIKRESYIKKLEELLKTVKAGDEYGQELPSVKTTHTDLFRFAKDNNLNWEPPQNGVALMMYIKALYGSRI